MTVKNFYTVLNKASFFFIPKNEFALFITVVIIYSILIHTYIYRKQNNKYNMRAY